MGLLSILLSALAVVCAGVGVLTTPIPKLGLVFAFGAPVLALAGIMLGGSAMSKAKKTGQTSETGRIGAILSALAFVPSVIVALTCGVCNAFFSTGNMQVQKDFHIGVSPFGGDGGTLFMPPPQRVRPGDPNADPNTDPNAPDPNAPDGQNAKPGTQPPGSHLKPAPHPGQPAANPDPPAAPEPQAPGALPPPPLPPGPGK
jgi:hypothetical protein